MGLFHNPARELLTDKDVARKRQTRNLALCSGKLEMNTMSSLSSKTGDPVTSRLTKQTRREARPPKGPPKEVDPRTLLIERGCEAGHLDLLVQLVKSVRDGKNVSFPTRPAQLFNPVLSKRRLDALEVQIQCLAKELAQLWTPGGAGFLTSNPRTRWMVQLPNLMTQYRLQLKALRYITRRRRPHAQSVLKSELVHYVRDATKELHGWHDEELAELCGEELRTWSKWRKNYYRPPSTITAEATAEVNIRPIGES